MGCRRSSVVIYLKFGLQLLESTNFAVSSWLKD